VEFTIIRPRADCGLRRSTLPHCKFLQAHWPVFKGCRTVSCHGLEKAKRPSSSTSSVPRKKLATANRKTESKGNLFRSSTAEKASARDEELSDATEDGHDLGVDDMDLRLLTKTPTRVDPKTRMRPPAEKRLRLAQMYLEGVKTNWQTGVRCGGDRPVFFAVAGCRIGNLVSILVICNPLLTII